MPDDASTILSDFKSFKKCNLLKRSLFTRVLQKTAFLNTPAFERIVLASSYDMSVNILVSYLHGWIR